MSKRVEKIPEPFRKEVRNRLRALGPQLKAARRKKGLTQEELAEHLNLSKNQIQFLEQGRRFGSLPTFWYVCLWLGLEPKLETASPQLRFLSAEEGRSPRGAYRTLLPVASLRAGAGSFGQGKHVETTRWVEVRGRKLERNMFVAQAIGDSMEPDGIRSGDYLVFRFGGGSVREGKIVLAELRESGTPDAGGSYVVKRFLRTKDGQRVVLRSSNPARKNIVVTPEERGREVRIVAEYLFSL